MLCNLNVIMSSSCSMNLGYSYCTAFFFGILVYERVFLVGNVVHYRLYAKLEM